MKILQVVNFLSPVHGGSAEVPFQLSKQLLKRGHQATIYTSSFRLSRDYVDRIPQAEVRPFKTWLGLFKFYITPGIIRKAKEELGQFDMIHMHNYRTFQNVVVHHYAKKYGIPYVLQAHGSLATFFQKRWLKRTFDAIWGNRILKHASKVIAVTRAEVEQYKSLGVSESKIEIVPNGIDSDQYENVPPKGEFRRRYGLSNGNKIILYLARINKIKGPEILAKAFARLARDLDNVNLVIAGSDDGYLLKLKKLIKRLKIEDKVLIVGFLYGREKLAAYNDADVYVLPSIYEVFGITVLEALACGTPVIVTDQCGIAEVIKDKVGMVVSPDEDSLRKAIRYLLANDIVRRNFGEKGKQLVCEQFTWAKVAEKIENIYYSILAES